MVCPQCPQPRLLPAAHAAAAAFMLCRTQWQHAPSGRPTGLRYADVLEVLRMHRRELGLKKSELPQLFAELQIIEQAFVTAVTEVMARGKADE